MACVEGVAKPIMFKEDTAARLKEVQVLCELAYFKYLDLLVMVKYYKELEEVKAWGLK